MNDVTAAVTTRLQVLDGFIYVYCTGLPLRSAEGTVITYKNVTICTSYLESCLVATCLSSHIRLHKQAFY
jgi:hypothetical protein